MQWVLEDIKRVKAGMPKISKLNKIFIDLLSLEYQDVNEVEMS